VSTRGGRVSLLTRLGDHDGVSLKVQIKPEARETDDEHLSVSATGTYGLDYGLLFRCTLINGFH